MSNSIQVMDSATTEGCNIVSMIFQNGLGLADIENVEFRLLFFHC